MTRNQTTRVHRPDGTRHAGRRTSDAPWRGRGFTLVELMVVVTIVILLVATMVPSMLRAQMIARNAQTKSSISTLSAACHMYKQDFDVYPDSKPEDDMLGRQRLVNAFYGPNDDGWRPAGRRTERYTGSTFGVTNVPRDGSGKARVFRDAFGQDIYYYAKREGTFHNDNSDDGPGNINTYAGTNVTGSHDFLLISKGYDRDWDTANKKDDVTNFR